MAPRAVLMKTGLKSFNTERPVNTVRSVNTGRPFSTARPFRSTVNTVRARGFNDVKPSACWVWRPIKPNGASLISKTLMEVMLLLVEEPMEAELLAKDASYFGDAAPRSVADAQIQDKDGLHNENDATEKSHDDSSLKDNGTAINTARPEINTGSREVSTASYFYVSLLIL
ncbi:hypothetical protein Tco_0836126, partial [Tanacetum coccineum]